MENSKIMLTFFLNHYLLQNGKKQINQFSDSKLKIYNICKNNFGLEKYLSIVNNFELRRSFTKLRTSSHRLQVELGRYQGCSPTQQIMHKMFFKCY